MNSPQWSQWRRPARGRTSEPQGSWERWEAGLEEHEPSPHPERPHRRRVLAIAIVLATLVGAVALAQVSSAGTRPRAPRTPVCTPGPTATAPASPNPSPTAFPTAGTIVEADGTHQHIGDGQVPLERRPGNNCVPSSSPTSAGPVVQPEGPGKVCDNSSLLPHDGFQNGNRCVAVDRGEVPLAENSPSLLIVSSPLRVRVNQPFEIRISTRNLVRDFFQPAAQGGYYNNRSFLNEEGIVHGHVHTSVRLLDSLRTAPDPAPVPPFFVATEDGRGSRTPDTFVIRVPGLATPGVYQIAAWCGDASHGVPMAQRANQTPCFDTARLIVTR